MQKLRIAGRVGEGHSRPGPSYNWEEQKAGMVAEDHDLLTGGKKEDLTFANADL